MAEPQKEKKKSHRKKKYTSYRVYINRELKQVHPDTGINRAAMGILEALIHYIVERIAFIVGVLLSVSGKETITSREIQNATRILLPGELAKHAASKLTKAVVTYYATSAEPLAEEAGRKKRLGAGHSRSFRAGLIMPVSRLGKELREHVIGHKRMGVNTPIALAAVVEYIVAEVLELSGNATKDLKTKRVTPRHIKLAVSGDEELDTLLKGTIFQGGVVPHIHKSLIKKKNTKKKSE